MKASPYLFFNWPLTYSSVCSKAMFIYPSKQANTPTITKKNDYLTCLHYHIFKFIGKLRLLALTQILQFTRFFHKLAWQILNRKQTVDSMHAVFWISISCLENCFLYKSMQVFFQISTWFLKTCFFFFFFLFSATLKLIRSMNKIGFREEY